jgi:hypothetical protein
MTIPTENQTHKNLLTWNQIYHQYNQIASKNRHELTTMKKRQGSIPN